MNTNPALTFEAKVKHHEGTIIVDATISNHGNSTVEIETLPPHTEILNREIFTIICNDKSVTYVGRLARRRPFSQNEFKKLAPGHKVAFGVRIDNTYELPESLAYCSVRLNIHIWNSEKSLAELAQFPAAPLLI